MKTQKIMRAGGGLSLTAGLVIAAALLAACTGSAAPSVPTAVPVVTFAPAATATQAATAAPEATATQAATLAATVPATGGQSTATAAAPSPAASTPTQGASGGASSGANSGSSAGPVGDPAVKQAVINAMQAYQKAGPYRVDTTILSGGKTQQMTAEVILPDRFHIKLATMEMLAVGGKSYVKQGDQWAALPMDVGGLVNSLTVSTQQEIINGMSNFKLIGPDVINGAPAIVYQFDSVFGTGADAITSTTKMWVDVASGLPVKQEINGTAAGVQSTTTQIITYDNNIKIEPPQ